MSVIAFSTTYSQTDTTMLTSYLLRPEELGGWLLVDSIRAYAGEGLFTLIDGGADLYFEYGFRQVVAAEYQKNQERSIKLELYEMVDAEAAYGRYSLAVGSQGINIQIGDEGLLNKYYLVFWKNRFLVFLSAGDTMSETSAGILRIATIVARNIGEPGKKPALLKYLLKEGLTITKYVRGILGLSTIYTFDTKDVFGMKAGVVGYYPDHAAFILQYNSEEEAKASYENAMGILAAGRRFSNFRMTREYWVMNDQKDSQLCTTQFKRLIVIVKAGQENDATSICDSVVGFIKTADNNRN
jgi:hypothetical protein